MNHRRSLTEDMTIMKRRLARLDNFFREYRFRIFLGAALFSGILAGIAAACGEVSGTAAAAPELPVSAGSQEVPVKYLGEYHAGDYPFSSLKKAEAAAGRKFTQSCSRARDYSPEGYLCRNPRLLFLEEELLKLRGQHPDSAAYLNGGQLFQEEFASCMNEEHPARCIEYAVLRECSLWQTRQNLVSFQDVSYECSGGAGLRVRYYDSEMPAARVCFSEDRECLRGTGGLLYLFPGNRGRFFSDGSSRGSDSGDQERLYPVRNGVRYERSHGVALHCSAAASGRAGQPDEAAAE